jgi:hypothetical protein
MMKAGKEIETSVLANLRVLITFGDMKHHLYPLIFLLLAGSCAYSQDNLRSGLSQDILRPGLSQDSTIRATLVQGIKYPRLVYSANGEVIGRRGIVARLELYTEPAGELQKYRDANAGFCVFLGVMLGSGIAAAAEGGQNNSGARYTFGGIAVAGLVGALVAAGQARLHLDRAVRIYNKRFIP